MNDQDWLEEGMREVCNAQGVDFENLLDKISDYCAREHEIRKVVRFSDAELRVLKAALEVAGGV